MVIFEDIQDVEEWLAPYGYKAFWDVVAPYGVFDEDDREHSDHTIANGIATQDLVPACSKVTVRLVLTERFGLKDRSYEPEDARCPSSETATNAGNARSA